MFVYQICVVRFGRSPHRAASAGRYQDRAEGREGSSTRPDCEHDNPRGRVQAEPIALPTMEFYRKSVNQVTPKWYPTALKSCGLGPARDDGLLLVRRR